MKISTWNVNGLRSVVKKGFDDWLISSKNDFVCLQEVKIQADLLTPILFQPYKTYLNAALKPGYSGVATLVSPNFNPVSIEYKTGHPLIDTEGRLLLVELDSFIIINTYAPHSHRKLLRLEAKMQYCSMVIEYIREIRSRRKPIIVVGDLNVAHKEADLENYASNKNNAGFLYEERTWMDKMLSLGLVDAFRLFHSDSGHYTWWSLMKNVRERNIGWRLDYILVDSCLSDKVTACYHLPDQRGSDHCPVTIEIDI